MLPHTIKKIGVFCISKNFYDKISKNKKKFNVVIKSNFKKVP